MSDSRNRVVNKRTVGNATKSLKLLILIAVIKTMIESAILKVNRTSSKNAGKGTSIMTKIMRTKTGIAPWVVGLGSLAVSKPRIFMRYSLFLVKANLNNNKVSDN